MDGTLKFLIGTACVVVIAAGGYYGWSEYQLNQAKKAQEEASMRIACRAMVSDLGRGQTKDYKGIHIATCINGGYVTEADFQAVNATQYVDQVRTLLKVLAAR